MTNTHTIVASSLSLAQYGFCGIIVVLCIIVFCMMSLLCHSFLYLVRMCILSCLFVCISLSQYYCKYNVCLYKVNLRGSKHDRIGDEMATMTRYGQLQEFDAENKSITAYLEWAELYFQANDIADEKQVAVLLSNIGAKMYGLLRNLVAPKAPKEKTFAEITSLLKSHFEPTPTVYSLTTGSTYIRLENSEFILHIWRSMIA